MMTDRYRKGARYERRAKQELEEDGWIVTRSAGSKGGADLVAIKVRQIQVKAVSEPKSWTADLEHLASWLPGGPGLTRELWIWNKRCGWEKHEISVSYTKILNSPENRLERKLSGSPDELSKEQ